MVHGTVHTVYICTDGVCDPLTRENARLAFAYITDNCTAREKERKRGTGRSRARVRDTRETGERIVHTHVYIIARACKKEKETSAIFMRAYETHRGGRAESFLTHVYADTVRGRCGN